MSLAFGRRHTAQEQISAANFEATHAGQFAKHPNLNLERIDSNFNYSPYSAELG